MRSSVGTSWPRTGAETGSRRSRATAAYVERASVVAASAELRDMGPLGHYMLKGASAWNAVAIDSALDLLAGT